MITKMATRGMNVARLNFSHGSHEFHQKLIDLVRKVNDKQGFKVTLLQDLEGYRIRVGKLKKRILVENNQTVFIIKGEEAGERTIPIEFEEDLKIIKKGMGVAIDDGTIYLKVLENDGKRLKCRVIAGGAVKSSKGVNVPGLKLAGNILTAKDKADIEFGVANKIDKIAQSFVRNKKDIQRVVDLVKPRLPQCKIIAKIETEEGVNNIESILDACDGIIVARGDLGVTLPIYKIPVLQKYVIRHCNRKKKLSIIATQMLDSMIENGRPTRAEVSDVANAILDGADYVMLSGETAVGKYPSRSIKMMSQILEYTEKYENIKPK
jgi:pyruvate kinase